jgi:hypothetical protein
VSPGILTAAIPARGLLLRHACAKKLVSCLNDSTPAKPFGIDQLEKHRRSSAYRLGCPALHRLFPRTGVTTKDKLPTCMAWPATCPAASPTSLPPSPSGSTPGSSIQPFPRTFPRFVQHAMWQYCSRSGLDVCNGNRINDAKRCGNMDCRVRPSVSVSLRAPHLPYPASSENSKANRIETMKGPAESGKICSVEVEEK